MKHQHALLLGCALAWTSAGAFSPVVRPRATSSSLRTAKEEKDEGDFIERVWTSLFGPKEESPFGMSRMTIDQFPDQFPAEYTRRAAPVSTDRGDAALVRPLLAQTELETRSLKVAYDAAVDGWTSDAFHRGVDKLGPGVVLCRSELGAVFGGYNPKGWVGYGEYRPGLSAFLFSWPDGDTAASADAPMVKLRKVGGAGMAQIDNPEDGPRFGPDGFTVPLSPLAPRAARSKLGAYYERMPNGVRTIFAPEEGGETTLTDFKVFVGVYAEDETIPFDDAMPLSLT